LRRAMSSAWVPIDPVEPRITTSRGACVAVTRLFCYSAAGVTPAARPRAATGSTGARPTVRRVSSPRRAAWPRR
jgi:hypothetical protein